MKTLLIVSFSDAQKRTAIQGRRTAAPMAYGAKRTAMMAPKNPEKGI